MQLGCSGLRPFLDLCSDAPHNEQEVRPLANQDDSELLATVIDAFAAVTGIAKNDVTEATPIPKDDALTLAAIDDAIVEQIGVRDEDVTQGHRNDALANAVTVGDWAGYLSGRLSLGDPTF